MALDLSDLAGRIAREVGAEVPAPPHEMVQRAYPALVEEAVELRDELEGGSLAGVRIEAADSVITAYLMEHYINAYIATLPGEPSYRMVLGAAVTAAFPAFNPATTREVIDKSARIAERRDPRPAAVEAAE